LVGSVATLSFLFLISNGKDKGIAARRQRTSPARRAVISGASEKKFS
jgi:hypothetical protein